MLDRRVVARRAGLNISLEHKFTIFSLHNDSFAESRWRFILSTFCFSRSLFRVTAQPVLTFVCFHAFTSARRNVKHEIQRRCSRLV